MTKHRMTMTPEAKASLQRSVLDAVSREDEQRARLGRLEEAAEQALVALSTFNGAESMDMHEISDNLNRLTEAETALREALR